MADEDLAYSTLDVFTRAPYAGNPLAVVWAADSLPAQKMQSIAAEFGYSETVFVCSASKPDVDASLRIFTPTFELDFAGHPTIGTAIAFAEAQGLGAGDTLVFEERAGLVPVDFYLEHGALHARLSPPMPPRLFDVPAFALDQALDFEGQGVIAAASAGTPFLFLKLDTPKAVDACAVQTGFVETMAAIGCTGVFVFARTSDQSFYARMFAPDAGIVEDPATGGAVAAFSAVLWDAGIKAGVYEIHQGVKMGRPSHIRLEMDPDSSGVLGAVHVGGSAVMMMQGRIRG